MLTIIETMRRNNKRIRYHNHNQENYLSEASVTSRSELGGYGRTKTEGTG